MTISKEENINSLKFTLLCFLASRFIIFTTIFLSAVSRCYPMPARSKSFYHVISDTSLTDIVSNLKSIFLAADAGWYMEIANYGYPIKEFTNAEALHWVFFPLFPLIVRLFYCLTDSYLLSALIINFICLLAALLTIRSLMQKEGFSAISIKLAIALICFHPLSYFYSAPFTESLFLLCLSSTLFFIQKKNLLSSSIVFGLCLISRPTGLLISPGIAVLARKRGIPILPFTILSSIPFNIFSVYLWSITGNPIAWLQHQLAWGREGTLLDLIDTNKLIISNLITPWSPNILHLASLVVLIYVLFHLHKKQAWGYFLISLLPILSAMSSGTLLSVSRLIMPLVVIPMTLTKTLSEDVLIIAILISAFLLGLMTLLYSLGVSIALA